MKKIDFKIVQEGREVSIVRVKSSAQKNNEFSHQRMRVMCFDSARIDRIFSIQEKLAKNSFKR